MTKLGEYKAFLERSRRSYETALMQIDRGFYDLAAFSPEQALQLSLKAHLLKLGVDYPRTNSVRKLLRMIYRVTVRKEVEELLSRFSVELGALEDAYITSRYVARDYSLEEVEKLRMVVEEVKRVVGEVVG